MALNLLLRILDSSVNMHKYSSLFKNPVSDYMNMADCQNKSKCSVTIRMIDKKKKIENILWRVII